MKIKQLMLTLFLASSLASFGQSSMTLTSQDSANSQQFKTTAGSNRTTVFEQLKHLLVTEAGEHYKTNASSNFTTKTELISLLGTPDIMNSTQLIGYYLNSLNGACMVMIGLDQTDHLLYYSIYDCN